MITETVVAGSLAKQLNLGSIVALLVVGMALGPHSPRPLLTGHVEELQTVGEIGVILLLFLVGLKPSLGDCLLCAASSSGRERMHFNLELAVAKYLAAPVSEIAVS